MSDVDPGHLYQVLRSWAKGKGQRTYSQLSKDYEARTGTLFTPRGTWDRPLGDMNKRLAEIGAPPISALVVLDDTGLPGGGFWGCASNVPARPPATKEMAVWIDLVNQVLAADAAVRALS